MRSRVHYNLRVSKPFLALLCLPLLMGGACEKKPKNNGDTGAINALDRAGSSGAAQTGPVDETPLQGIDVSKLSTDKQKLFYKLVGSLSSPCGKAHSLRTSVTSDQTCKRAPFAARLVAELLADEQDASTVLELYTARYVRNAAVQTIDVAQAPMSGDPKAPVVLVEYFDYGCPSCMAIKPVLDQVVRENPGKVKLYYKMYPLIGKHPDSKGAAQAALAAHAQGKFHAMHDVIFERLGAQKKDDLRGYAQALGLDLARYDADFAAAEARVDADRKEGDANGVEGTPTLFLNGRRYPGPTDPKYFAAAIEEELAVRR